MRALTVRQPWAWSIIHGGKDVENRSRNIAGSYRGPVAIHAGQQWSKEGGADPLVMLACRGRTPQPWFAAMHSGAIVGVVELVSVHHDSDHGRGYPCSPWAMTDHWHMTLANPRPLAEPIPATGRLGLWTPDADLLAQIDGEVTA